MSSLSKNIIYKVALNFFNIVVPLIIGPYTFRVLGPALNGRYNYCNSVLAYFLIFANFGVYNYGLRELSKLKNDKSKLRKTFSNLFIISTITNIITLLIYIIFIKNKFMSENYIVMYMLSFILASNIFYVEWANEALEKYKFITIKTIVTRIVYLIGLISIVKDQSDFNKYILLIIVWTFSNNFISFIFILKDIRFDFSKIEIKKHLYPMLIVVILANANMLFTQLDRVALGKFDSNESVAYYTISLNIINIITSTIMSIVMVTIPRLSYNIANNEKIKYNELLKKACNIFLLILIPASLGIFLLSKEIIVIYGGSEYIQAVSTLKCFSFYMILLGIEYILTNQILYVHNKDYFILKAIILTGIINLIIKFIIIEFNILSPKTSIITTIISCTILIICELIYIKKYLEINLRMFVTGFKYLLISIIFIPVYYLLRIFVNNYLIVVVFTILINSLIYFSILIFLKDKAFMYMINILISKLNK